MHLCGYPGSLVRLWRITPWFQKSFLRLSRRSFSEGGKTEILCLIKPDLPTVAKALVGLRQDKSGHPQFVLVIPAQTGI